MLWLCACVKQAGCCGSAYGEREGLYMEVIAFFSSIGVITAKYWEGKRDCGYGRGMRLRADPSDS